MTEQKKEPYFVSDHPFILGCVGLVLMDFISRTYQTTHLEAGIMSAAIVFGGAYGIDWLRRQ